MPLKIDGELIVNAPRVLGVTSGLIPVTTGVGPTGVTTTTVRQPTQTVNTILKGADPGRIGLSIFNNSTANMFVKLGAVASIGAGTESFTKKIPPGLYYEIPFGYTGRVDALWDAADATGEALLFEQFTSFSPLSITTGNTLWWFRANYGVTNPGGTVPAWTDHSGQNRNLAQAVAGDQPAHLLANLNGQDVIQFGPASDNWMPFVAPTVAIPTRGTVYAAIRMHQRLNYQLYLFIDGGGPTCYLGGDNADFPRNRPCLYPVAFGDKAVWGADLADVTPYIVKWAWDLSGGVTDNYFTQVNAGTEVSDTSGNLVGPGNFISLGLNPAISAIQDLEADIVETFCIDTDLLTATDELNIRNYLNAKIAAF